MTGFFGSYSKNMTELSAHYLDWSRVGSLIYSTSHRYSTSEMLSRTGVISSTALGGLFAYRQCNSSFYVNKSLWSMAGCFVGFMISHTLVLLPLLNKRLEMKAKCEQLEENISQLFVDVKRNVILEDEIELDNIQNNVVSLMVFIMKQSQTTETLGNASLTWGRRCSNLANLEHCLKEGLLQYAKGDLDILDLQGFWQQAQEQLLTCIEASSFDFKLINSMLL